MVVLVVLASLAAVGSMIFNGITAYWHHCDRKEHRADMARLTADEKRLTDDESRLTADEKRLEDDELIGGLVRLPDGTIHLSCPESLRRYVQRAPNGMAQH
jgi:hypothetical protein